MRLALPLAALLLAAAPLAADVGLVEVTRGLKEPLFLTAPAHVKDRLWVVERAGKIWIVDKATGKKHSKPFLDIEDRVNIDKFELGLLGLAFAPDFERSGRFYVNFTNHDLVTEVVRFTMEDPRAAVCSPEAGETILSFRQDFWNHDGGWTAFGPDGMLYVSTGDGGSSHDPKDRGQDLGSLLGKLLRLDVSSEKGYTIPPDNPFVEREGIRPEIYCWGLRNPWRCSFDRKTGALFIGDVGQNTWEEINYGTLAEIKGANFGWRLREGLVATPTTAKPGQSGIGGDRPENNRDPIYVYKSGLGPMEGKSVTGGYMYRGPVESLRGKYLFADWINPRIWCFEVEDGKAVNVTDLTDQVQPKDRKASKFSSFGEDTEGDVYLFDYSGYLYRFAER